eukprot:3032618-Lingulodinium_polyedra.AAC.1
MEPKQRRQRPGGITAHHRQGRRALRAGGCCLCPARKREPPRRLPLRPNGPVPRMSQTHEQ